jgi:hypothetical protein
MSNAATILGTCWGTPNGQDLSSPSYMASGFQCVAEAVARRWSTPYGALLYDPDYGYDVTDEVGDDLSPSDIAQMQAKLQNEAQKDERVKSCSATVTLTVAGLLTIVAQIQTAAGPFQLVLAVSAVNVSILMVTQ